MFITANNEKISKDFTYPKAGDINMVSNSEVPQ
jgi:hypothetical protein